MTDRIPLLLLPGLLNDAELWRAQLADLADIADCTVGDQTRGETLQAVAEDVLAQAPERFALAGFSLGGSSPSRFCASRRNACCSWRWSIPRSTPIHRNVPNNAAANAPVCACRGSSTASAMR